MRKERLIEEWKDIPGWEGLYQASTLGRVKSLNPGKRIINKEGILKPILATNYKGNSKYYRHFITLRRKPVVKQYSLGPLILFTFVRAAHEGEECRHLNDDSLDNRLTNLAWGTHRDNADDAVRNGAMSKGSSHVHSKLNEDQAKYIKETYDGKYGSIRSLAKQFNVTDGTVWFIVRGKTWKHVQYVRRSTDQSL